MTDLLIPSSTTAPPGPRGQGVVGSLAHRIAVLGRQFSDLIGLRTAGWVALVVAVVLVVAGLVLHWNELLLAAVMVLVLVMVALLFTIGRPRYAVRLALRENRVVVGDAAAGSLSVRNQAPRRTLPSRLDLPVGERLASFSVPSLGGSAEHIEPFEIPTDRRGVIQLGPAQTVQSDPFSLAGRSTRWTGRTELFVHPVTVSLPGRQTGFIHDLEGHASTQLTASDMSFHALREYAPGDDRRHVHWRSSARTGQLMVRQFEQTLQSRVALGLDTGIASYLDRAEFELAVSAVGSVALQCVREENPLALMSTGQRLASVSALRTLDELSRVERSGRTGIQDLVKAMIHREPGASIAILVTGSGVAMADLRRALNAFEVDTRVIAVMADPNQPLSVRTVGNTTVVRVDELDQLPRAMRRAMP